MKAKAVVQDGWVIGPEVGLLPNTSTRPFKINKSPGLIDIFMNLSPLGRLILFFVAVTWSFILFTELINTGRRNNIFNRKAWEEWWYTEAAPTPATPKETYDGTNRNEYVNVQADKVDANYEPDPLICQAFGYGCVSRSTDKWDVHKITPEFYLVDEPFELDGVQMRTVSNLNRTARMTLREAILDKDQCRGLTKQEAVEFLCDRDITSNYLYKQSQGWYRTEMCTREVVPEDCDIWSACLETIAATHFSKTTRPFFGNNPFLGTNKDNKPLYGYLNDLPCK